MAFFRETDLIYKVMEFEKFSSYSGAENKFDVGDELDYDSFYNNLQDAAEHISGWYNMDYEDDLLKVEFRGLTGDEEQDGMDGTLDSIMKVSVSLRPESLAELAAGWR